MRSVIVATSALLMFTSSAFAQNTSCSASLAAYKQLSDGMSYSSAISIIGCEGSELSSSEMMGIKTVMYMWEGSGGLGANMNAMFQDDRLVSKAQFGLK